MANGECWWWIPEKHILQRVQVRPTRTFDSSPTRTRGHSRRTPATFADVDLAAISDRIAATIERAKASDPKALTKRIRELEKALAARQQATSPAEPKVVEVPIEVPVLDEALVARLEAAATALTQAREATDTALSDLLGHLQQTLKESKETTRQATEAADGIAAALSSAQAEPRDAPAPPRRTAPPPIHLRRRNRAPSRLSPRPHRQRPTSRRCCPQLATGS